VCRQQPAKLQDAKTVHTETPKSEYAAGLQTFTNVSVSEAPYMVITPELLS